MSPREREVRQYATDLPVFGSTPLKGDRAGYWAISVSRNWRMVFRFEGRDATDVDLIDYHQE